MAEERNLFERMDEISANQAEILGQVTGFKAQTDVKFAAIEQELSKLANQPSSQIKTGNGNPQNSNQEILHTFLKQSKKSWRWFGTAREFLRSKNLAIISLVILLVVGLSTSIVSTICFNLYSTFTALENIWMVFAIIHIVYVSKTKITYEVNSLASNSSVKFERDNLGMMFPKKQKFAFRLFKWLAIISVICNIICIWAELGKTNKGLATIMEIFFLAAIIFASIAVSNLFAQYSIIWVEGHNLTTREKVVLVLPPGAKQLMPEEEFKKKMPFFYE